MKKIYTLFAGALLSLSAAFANETDYLHGLSIWFDTPNTLEGRAIWYGGHPERWKGKEKPETGGDCFSNPDPDWETRSLPIGNGSLGANIMGSIEAERITFNEKTLWRGGPNTSAGAEKYWNVNKQSAHLLEKIRQAFMDGDTDKATKLTCKNFNSDVAYDPTEEKPFRFGNFTTMGEFYIETGLSTVGMSNYKRILSLDSALAVVQFAKDGVKYERKYFISYPHNVMVVRFSADKPGMQNLTFSYLPNPVSEGEWTTLENHELLYTAHLDNNGMNYAVRIHPVTTGGTLTSDGNRLKVKDAHEVVFYITADTDYRMNFHPDFGDPKTYVGTDPVETTRKWIDDAVALGFEPVFKAHYDDYSALFNRVKLHLNPAAERQELPTSQRLRNYRKGKADYHLEELYYQFGRYLLISSSRPGNMPANLQGIWHNNVDGPWHVDYHNNINLQMNYWPAHSTNLTECASPLLDFIRTLVEPGQVTARSYFGARGWTASISSNIFGFTAPLGSEDMRWNFNPIGGPWLATHAWEHYEYTRDKKFLKETGYDLIKGGALFAVDYLWHKPDGTYTAAPSTSPEHGPIDQGATFVHGVIREILLDAIAASKVLGVDAKERKEWEKALNGLAPYRIGRYGQLMEWSVDIDDPEDDHRHVNHLFALHPGRTISPVTTPGLAEASRVVLNHRGDGATGWSMGWKLNQWARLHDGNRAYKLYGNLLKNGTSDNLWDTHPPFQIDGNLGGTAGVTEMLLQSHLGFIQLLPSLPDAWEDGAVEGLCAKGGFEVSITWKGHRLEQATLLSKAGETCTVYYGKENISFKTVKGKQYTIILKDGKLTLYK